MASTIDKWFSTRNMVLQPPVNNASIKKYNDNRGGFTAEARYAKSQIVMMFMNHLYIQKKWRIAKKSPSVSKVKPKPPTRDYKPICVAHHNNDFTTELTKKTSQTLYYVVTPISTGHGSCDPFIQSESRKLININNYVDIYYESLALEMSLMQDIITGHDLKKLIEGNSYAIRNSKVVNVRYLAIEDTADDDGNKVWILHL